LQASPLRPSTGFDVQLQDQSLPGRKWIGPPRTAALVTSDFVRIAPEGPTGPTGAAGGAVISTSLRVNPSDGTVFGSWGNGTELVDADVQVPMPAGTASVLRFCKSPAPGVTESATITLRKNGVDTSLACTITGDGSTTTYSELASQATLNDGDMISFLFNRTGFTVNSIRVSFKFIAP